MASDVDASDGSDDVVYEANSSSTRTTSRTVIDAGRPTVSQQNGRWQPVFKLCNLCINKPILCSIKSWLVACIFKILHCFSQRCDRLSKNDRFYPHIFFFQTQIMCHNPLWISFLSQTSLESIKQCRHETSRMLFTLCMWILLGGRMNNSHVCCSLSAFYFWWTSAGHL